MNYFEKLKNYYEREGIVPVERFNDSKFHCVSKMECRKSCPQIRACAQAYVGENYEKTQIMFVGIDYGKKDKLRPTLPTMEQQRRDNESAIGKNKNPHMYGTTGLLMELLNCSCDCVLKYFALTNWVKCSASIEKQRSEATPMMKNNCFKHLLEEIKILEPKLIVFQGAGISDLFKKKVEKKNTQFIITKKEDSDMWWKLSLSREIGMNYEINCLFLWHPAAPRGYYQWYKDKKIASLIQKIRKTLPHLTLFKVDSSGFRPQNDRE